MNQFPCNLRRALMLSFFGCLCLLSITEATAQFVPPPTRPTRPPIDPPKLGDGCLEVSSSSNILPIRIYNNNNEPITISNITLDNVIYGYTSTSGSIPAYGDEIFYVTFNNGLTIEDVFGAVSDFVVDINFDMSIGTYPNIVNIAISDKGYYCVTHSLGNGDDDNDDGGAVYHIDGRNNRLSTEASGTKDINISPNPTKKDINVNFEISEDNTSFCALIYNSLGQEVKSLVQNSSYLKGSYSESYDISELDNGMYFLVIRIGEEMKTISISKL